MRETYADGAHRIRFSPIAAKDALEAMKQLAVAYLESKDDADISQFLLMPCVILDFLGVRPFRDGGGENVQIFNFVPSF